MGERIVLRSLVTAAAIFLACQINAQDTGRGMMTMARGDLAAIKQKAEAGDAVAQVTLGDSLASLFRPSEALAWYRKAAAQGNVDAKYNIGQMLLSGAGGSPLNLSVHASPKEGLWWTFMAATNSHAGAWLNMARALRDGNGTGRDLVEAYAWATLYSETAQGSIMGRPEMNGLALTMDIASLQKAKAMADQFRAGNWQAALERAKREEASRFQLGGITLGGSRAVAVINGRTFWEGRSAKVQVKGGTLRVECLKIEKDSVLVSVEGEKEPRLLRAR